MISFAENQIMPIGFKIIIIMIILFSILIIRDTILLTQKPKR